MEAKFIAMKHLIRQYAAKFITRRQVIIGIGRTFRINCDNEAPELYSKNNKSSSK